MRQVDPSCEIMGIDSSLPLYLSAVALQKLGHKEGELTWARAAKSSGVIQMVPTLSSCSNDDIFAEGKKLDTPQWFQLYVNSNRGEFISDPAVIVVSGSLAMRLP